MNLILKRIGKKSGIIILGFILFMGALCTPFVALNEWLEHPISTTVDIIFGDNSSYSLKENVNVKVLKYKSEVEKWCAKDMNGYLDVSNYVNVILAIMMVESGGEGNDPMQSSECSKNTKYSKKPNSIKDPKYSIECGVKDFADALSQSVTSGLVNNDALFTAVDAYNKGLGIIKRHSKNKKYSFEDIVSGNPAYNESIKKHFLRKCLTKMTYKNIKLIDILSNDNLFGKLISKINRVINRSN